MATVTELSDPYANFMLSPLPPAAPDVCSVCLTFTEGWSTCYPCGHQARFADAVLPISYSVAFGQLHTALQQYKRGYPSAARQFQIQLAAVLWRFVSLHEVPRTPRRCRRLRRRRDRPVEQRSTRRGPPSSPAG
jgi:hypothetical protein